MSTNQADLTNRCSIHVRCPDLSAALDFYTAQPGFRLDLIYPADNPRLAKLSGHGITLRLESECSDMPPESPDASKVIVQTPDDDSWVTGRAGMRYRDLLPGRQGGEFIASHIRIPNGGPVADYVHHHQVRFQMIFCFRGWVRVVYEDQGDPIVMRPGDCVLQPPHIRHRVLESSDGMEVIEIGSPAEHETRVDHGMVLPNGYLNPNRDFEGQRFVFHRAAESAWKPGPQSGFEMRDTGINRATGGLADVVVMRPLGPAPERPAAHDHGFYFSFVLNGSLELETGQNPRRRLAAGDCFLVPRGVPFAQTGLSPDLEILRVTLPGRAR